MIQYLRDREIYETVVLENAMLAKRSLWIATSDLKDMYVGSQGKMVPFLSVLNDLLRADVSVRLIHAKEPGQAFRDDFDRFPLLHSELERLLCPRTHLKLVIVDGRSCYLGSANVTGAGMGAKSKDKRNFEAGIWTDDPQLVDSAIEQFDAIWMGSFCKSCRRQEFCIDCPLL